MNVFMDSNQWHERQFMATNSPGPPVLSEVGDRVKFRPPRQQHDRLDDDRMLIVWGASRCWTIKKIAMTLPASQTTVKNFKAKIFDDPVAGVRLSGAGRDRTQSISMPLARREPGILVQGDAACARPHPAREDSQRSPA